jgi:sporulation protein YlmC with PRC-barrel domain
MRLSELLFLEIVTKDGRTLGHLVDLRCQGKPETNEADVREFLYGYGGLLESIGLKKMASERIPWESVLRIEGGKIVITRTPTKLIN